MKQKIIKVKTKSKNYEVHIGTNLFPKLKNILKTNKVLFSKCLIVIDSKIPKKFRTLLLKNLKNQNIYTLNFNANEKNKSYLSIDKIHNVLFKNNFYREDCIISFGGGITGDVVGYAASTYKRGIKFINIPSTLLAQVDSSIGGKTGINNKFGKNLVGSFYQPDLVISDINLLRTLPKREIICGYAEILKSSLIDSKKNFVFLDKNFNKILNLKGNFIINAILNSCLLKKKIIEKDEKEKNLRKSLNLGHTFAHAYEATLGYSKKLNHGEAVIFGLMNAVNFSKEKKIISDPNSELINNHIKKIEIKNKFKDLFNKRKITSILNFMKSDKKNKSDSINLILIRNFGKLNLNYQAKPGELNKFLLKELNKAYL
ncbi:3-dehydroquinate synthase [Candidatus Pelagibacter sp.]|nr:3-dehydroquinate synthase [Candidatus Pelagibacter sp.]